MPSHIDRLEDKENAKPRELTVKSKRNSKLAPEGQTDSKKQIKSECQLEEIPITDKTNIGKDNLTFTQNQKGSNKR